MAALTRQCPISLSLGGPSFKSTSGGNWNSGSRSDQFLGRSSAVGHGSGKKSCFHGFPDSRIAGALGQSISKQTPSRGKDGEHPSFYAFDDSGSY